VQNVKLAIKDATNARLQVEIVPSARLDTLALKAKISVSLSALNIFSSILILKHVLRFVILAFMAIKPLVNVRLVMTNVSHALVELLKAAILAVLEAFLLVRAVVSISASHKDGKKMVKITPGQFLKMVILSTFLEIWL